MGVRFLSSTICALLATAGAAWAAEEPAAQQNESEEATETEQPVQLAQATQTQVAQAAETQVAQAGAPAQGGDTLETVLVKGAFIAAESTSALKLDVPVRDIPFSVSSYTDDFIKAIETTRVADMYSYMTGVNRSGQTGYDLTLRGFRTTGADRNAIMMDGMPGLAARFGSPATVAADHIEVVKGPASVLYGQAQPGGFVNIITKKPETNRSAEIDLRARGYQGADLSIGNALTYTGSVDFTGPIDDENRFLYRLIAEYEDGDGFRDFTGGSTLYVTPSLTWNIGDNTSATLKFEYRHEDQAADDFLVAVNEDYRNIAAITTHYQDPEDTLEETGKTAGLTVSHALSDNITWNTNLRSVWHEDHKLAFENAVAIRDNPMAPSTMPPSMNRRARDQLNNRDYRFIDTNLAMDLETGSIGHKVLAGLNGGEEISDFQRNKFFLLSNTVNTTGAAGNLPCNATFTSLTRQQCSLEINLIDPAYSDVPLSAFPATAPGLAAHRYTKQVSYSGYLSDLVTLSEKWKVMAGVRYEHSTTDTDELNVTTPVPTRTSTFSDVLPLAGVIFQPTEHWSIYGSYSSSFAPPPASAIGISGEPPQSPEQASQYEAGVKADFIDGRLNTTISFFEITKQDVVGTVTAGTTVGGETCGVAPNPVQATCTVLVGEERARGAELEIDAQLMDGWHVTAGYAYTDTEVTKTDPTTTYLLGSRLLAAPLNAAHLWTRYDIADGPLAGLGFGLGIVYVDDRLGTLGTGPSPGQPVPSGQTTDTNGVLILPSYSYADAGIYYVRDNFDLTLKVANIGDKTYYESAGSQGTIQVVPGNPRNVALSFRMSF